MDSSEGDVVRCWLSVQNESMLLGGGGRHPTQTTKTINGDVKFLRSHFITAPTIQQGNDSCLFFHTQKSPGF